MSKRIAQYVKTPAEAKDYSATYARWLAGDTLKSLAFAVTPAGLVSPAVSPLQITAYQINADNASITYKAEDGDDGETYNVIITATTAADQVKQDLVVFTVRALQ
jgi:hypothetical protein